MFAHTYALTYVDRESAYYYSVVVVWLSCTSLPHIDEVIATRSKLTLAKVTFKREYNWSISILVIRNRHVLFKLTLYRALPHSWVIYLRLLRNNHTYTPEILSRDKLLIFVIYMVIHSSTNSRYDLCLWQITKGCEVWDSKCDIWII